MATKGNRNSFCPICRAKLLVDLVQVLLYTGLGDSEKGSDVVV